MEDGATNMELGLGAQEINKKREIHNLMSNSNKIYCENKTETHGNK